MRSQLLKYLVVLLPLVFSCASPQKSYHKAIAKAPFDVVIVPGIPYQNGTWESNIMKDRVVWACFLYSRGITKHIIFSGNAVYSPYVEGKVMALHAIALGIPDSAIFSEMKAEHSTENLVYSYRMAKKLGFEKIAVATDPGQSVALKTYAWDFHIPVSFIPIVYDSLKTFPVDSIFHVDPSPARVNNFTPLPQRENGIKRLLGTIGLDIQPEPARNSD
ncbi:MAG: YdcF family protein [Bacteroidetes bacterium]|nr:YdcF family protein [Bacteroidota bacterium]